MWKTWAIYNIKVTRYWIFDLYFLWVHYNLLQKTNTAVGKNVTLSQAIEYLLKKIILVAWPTSSTEFFIILILKLLEALLVPEITDLGFIGSVKFLLDQDVIWLCQTSSRSRLKLLTVLTLTWCNIDQNNGVRFTHTSLISIIWNGKTVLFTPRRYECLANKNHLWLSVAVNEDPLVIKNPWR